MTSVTGFKGGGVGVGTNWTLVTGTLHIVSILVVLAGDTGIFIEPTTVARGLAVELHADSSQPVLRPAHWTSVNTSAFVDTLGRVST